MKTQKFPKRFLVEVLEHKNREKSFDTKNRAIDYAIGLIDLNYFVEIRDLKNGNIIDDVRLRDQ